VADVYLGKICSCKECSIDGSITLAGMKLQSFWPQRSIPIKIFLSLLVPGQMAIEAGMNKAPVLFVDMIKLLIIEKTLVSLRNVCGYK
jgi:hypothetical protein